LSRPTKSREERVRSRSFLARRHGGLVAGPLTAHSELREIQAAYQDGSSERERRLAALDFEKKVSGTFPTPGGRRVGGCLDGGLAPADFFPKSLTHTKGPAAGRPFLLERWQPSFVDESREARRDRDLVQPGLFLAPSSRVTTARELLRAEKGWPNRATRGRGRP
jgi:hypothetical protein